MHRPRLHLRRSYLPLLIAAAAPSALLAQEPPPRATAAHEAAHVLQQSPGKRAAGAQTVLVELIQQPVPRGLTEDERQQWTSQTDWLRSIERRIADVIATASAPGSGPAAAAPPRTTRRELDKATPQLARAADGSEDGAGDAAEALELQLTRLQEAVQQESRRFQTLSNAMKARHDAAMSSIRNMK